MTENRPTRRRWFQFSLRTFLVVITLVGLGFAWVGMQLEQKRRHEAVAKQIRKLGGGVSLSWDGDVPAWKEWLFGSHAVKSVVLDLANTNATDSLLSQTEGMNLLALYLNAPKVTDVGLTHLNKLTSLEHLVLNNTQVTDEGLMQLQGLTSLKAIGLDNSKITDAGLTNLKWLIGLEVLSLDNTRITDAGLTNLKGLTRLNELSLNNTLVTNEGLIQLQGLTSLERLLVRNTQVTDVGSARLHQTIPNCRIYYSP